MRKGGCKPSQPFTVFHGFTSLDIFHSHHPIIPPSQVRLLLGFVRRGFLQKLYEQTQVQPGSSKVWKLVCALESRLAMFALRMGLAHDILAANVVLRRKVSGGVDSGWVLPPGKREISVEH